jgi:hypothetical protein
LIVNFTYRGPRLSVGQFNSQKIEIKKNDRDKWEIWIDGEKTEISFDTRERSIRMIQESAEKIVYDNMNKAVANQKPLSPRFVMRRPFPKRFKKFKKN